MEERRVEIWMFLLWKKPLVSSYFITNSSGAHILMSSFSLVIWKAFLGGDHLISGQNKFHRNSSLSSRVLPSRAACDLEEARRHLLISVDHSQKLGSLTPLMHHHSWKVWFTSEQSLTENPCILAKHTSPHPSARHTSEP